MAAVTVAYDRRPSRPGPVSPWSFLRILPVPQPLLVARLGRDAVGRTPLVPLVEGPPASRPPPQVSYVTALAVGRRRVPMRLEIEAWSAGTSRVEMVPLRRVRTGRRYLTAGHRFLDGLAEASVPG